MDPDKIGHHINEKFNRELEDIRNQVLIMGELVEQQVELALNAFTSGNFKLAEQVIKQCDQVDTIGILLDQECMQVLALRQPTAFDLRFLITVIKIIYELETIGELTEYIAKMTIQLPNIAGNRSDYPELQNLSKSVKDMLHTALGAFSKINAIDIAAITKLDKHAYHEYTGICLQLTSQMMEDPKNITRTLNVLRTARALERMGDHSFHIWEELIYMVNGGSKRHLTRTKNTTKD